MWVWNTLFRIRYHKTFKEIRECPCGDLDNLGCECCVVRDSWLSDKWMEHKAFLTGVRDGLELFFRPWWLTLVFFLLLGMLIGGLWQS